MSFSVVVLSNDEKFLQFLDPDLCEVSESMKSKELRTLNFEYKFQDLQEDKKLFQIGNKIWVSSPDTRIHDCLYVINTDVENSIYDGNYFKIELEEVLVELNNAPLVHQNEISANSSVFSISNGTEININWNALNFWFGAYFNIGVVQKCLTTTAGRITLTGSMTRMSLLRYIEEQTGNIFVTRYEKDVLTNTIHRYLDFLNPINVSKDWEYNIEYEFINNSNDYSKAFDENGNPVSDANIDVEDADSDAVEYPPASIEDDIIFANIDPDDVIFRLVDEDYKQLTISGYDLNWTSEEIGLEDNSQSVVLQLTRTGSVLGLETLTKSFVVQGENVVGGDAPCFISTSSDPDYTFDAILPDDCYFEMYDTVRGKVVFRTCLNTQIGHVHEEILDFGFNLENILFNVDETNTYNAVSPVISLNENEGGANELSRTDIGTILTRWINLSVTKGQTIPMIVQKVNVSASSLAAAKTSLGTYSLSSNYWIRPLKPSDNTDSDPKTFEFYKATAYWRAPYTKYGGEFHVETDKDTTTQYQNVRGRPDTRDMRATNITPKMGVTECSDEDIYGIYNQVCQYLQEHEFQDISISLDVANLKDGEFNNYDIHDKIYLKLPDSQELITARVVETVKDANDMSKDSIVIDNYSINTVKTIQYTTYLESSNVQFKYPTSSSLTCRLINADYDSNNSEMSHYPANKLLTFSVYQKENGSSKFTGDVYTKLTDANGYAKIPLKLDPADYEIEIYYPGDEEYSETSTIVNVNVGGTKETAVSTSNTSRSTKSNKKVVKTYWTKCGVSPDSKHSQIVSIAKPSASYNDARKYGVSMTALYKTIFKNKCPHCGKATLRFDGGKANKCLTSAGAHNRGYKINVPEHEITCNNCDADFDGVTGLEKNYGHSTRLTMIKKPVRSNQTEFNKLVKGKLQYGTKTVSNKTKKVTSTKTRTYSSGIPNYILQIAKNIIGDSKGWVAAKKIAAHCTKWKYSYYTGFQRNAQTVIKNGRGNCCDQTRAMLTLMDAAGCLEYLKLYYVHVCCGPKGVGHMLAKLQHKTKGTQKYVDPCNQSKGAWNGPIKGWGSPPGNQTVYSYGSTPF